MTARCADPGHWGVEAVVIAWGEVDDEVVKLAGLGAGG